VLATAACETHTEKSGGAALCCCLGGSMQA
jgi:hypothetical protein